MHASTFHSTVVQSIQNGYNWQLASLIKMGINEQHCTMGQCIETECMNKSVMTCNEDLQVNL